MADSRRPDSLLVDSALAAGTAHVRRVAALSIGRVGLVARTGRLVGLLADADTTVAANAAFALGLLRDSSTVAPLAMALGGAPAVAGEAAWALGEIGSPARTAVLEGLAASDGSAHLAELLRAAAKLRPLPVDEIVPFLDGSDAVRTAAAYALGRTRTPAAVRHMLRVVANSAANASAAQSSDMLASAARGLAATAAGDSLRAPALAALAGLVRHGHPHVRINALRSLATFGDAGREAIFAAVRDPDPNVRIAAAGSAGTVMDSARVAWRELWAADTGLTFRASLLAAAVPRGGASLALELAGDWPAHPDWRHRAALAASLAGSPPAPARSTSLDQLATDSDSRVRAAAVAAMQDSTAGTLLRQRLLAFATNDQDPFVRAAALAGLRGGARGKEMQSAVAAYHRAAQDSVDEARMAALALIVATWRRDSSGVTAAGRAALEEVEEPASPLERLAGRAISPLARWRGEEGTPRPLAWYEERVRRFVEPSLAGRPAIAEIVTARGVIVLALHGADAPLTVDNFVALVRSGYYHGSRFHRVVPNFVAQDGDPRGDGNGGPGYAIRDELNRHRYARGALGMALSGPHTGGSQYFLTHSPQPHLDGHYTVFGRIIDGMDVLDAIVQGDVIEQVRVR